ncbi:MAG TPA: DUF6319 family protein [Pseudonocardiaceae bacterium]
MTSAINTAATPQSTAAQAAPASPTASKPADVESTKAEPTNTEPAKAQSAPAAKRGRKPSTARKVRTVELTLTVTGTAEGEWQAELSHSGKRVVSGLQIPAAAVSRAAKELHPDISDEIEAVITAAREQHEARLAELQAELDKVKQALAELDD